MIGQNVGHYRVLDKLGEGGMGTVYLAQDTLLDRRVALKFVRQDALDENARQRLIREAKASAAIDHPSVCKVYEIGEWDGRAFIAMEYVAGETLEVAIGRGPLDSDLARRIASDVAEALSDAHARGILHRDLKPSNIMLTPGGHVKVMDFGLATRTARLESGGTEDETWTRVTQQGTIIGTLPYMSPEQLLGEALDPRSDVFSFGIILYEMLTGTHPYRRSTAAATAAAILKEPTPSIATGDVPKALRRAVAAALTRDRNRRPAAADLSRELRALRRSGKARFLTAAVLIGAVAVASTLWLYRRSVRERQALELLPRIESLAEEADFASAYELALRVEAVLGPEPVSEWMPRLSDRWTVVSDPPGARVSLKRFDPSATEEPEPVLVGHTPIENVRMARADYVTTLAKEGFATVERPLSSRVARSEAIVGTPPVLEVALVPSSEVPPDMVAVSGGDYALVGRGVQNADVVTLDDFFIDRYEVSNRQFKRFIDTGGYADDRFWVHGPGDETEIDSGREAFVDRTGLPGPREWVNQTWPEAKEDHPVTGVSWYEAAAYCESMEKALPTAYQWEKAARNGRQEFVGGQVMPWGIMNRGDAEVQRANFATTDTVKVDSMEFGMSPFGAFHMAGNVEEWLLNRRGEHFATAGGSWLDPVYIFGEATSRPASTVSRGLGFRCASMRTPSTGDQGAEPLSNPGDLVRPAPVDDLTFRGFTDFYRYDKKPLQPTIEGTFTPDDGTFARQRVTFNGVEDRIVAYLYLPQRAPPPYQVLFYVVSAAVLMGQPVPNEVEWMLMTHLRSGRAIFSVVPRGAEERPWPGQEWPSATIAAAGDWVGTVSFRDRILMHVKEYQIGLDFLETRDDVDTSEIAYVGLSYGAGVTGIVLNAIEDRFASLAFVSGGLHPVFDRILPEANPTHFAPRIRAPKLLVNGKYDEVHPIEISAQPLFDAWSEPKRLIVTESGHLPSVEARGRILKEWFDETLGQVKQ